MVPKDTVINEIKQFPLSILQVFQQIAKFAFNGLVADKTVFTAGEILDDNLELLHCVEHCDAKSFNFLHLSLQEFMAAFYIAGLNIHEIPKHFKELYDNSIWFSEVWTLYSNLAGEKGLRQNLRLVAHFQSLPIHDYVLQLNTFQSKNATFDPGTLSPALRNSILQQNGCHNYRPLALSADVWRLILDNQKASTTSSLQFKPACKTQRELCSEENLLLQKVLDNPIKIIYLFKCSLEAKVDTLCEVLSKSFSDNIIILKNYKLSAQHIEYLGLFLTSKAKWIEINLCNCQIGDEGIIILHRYLCRVADKKQEISTMDFMNNGLSAVSLPFISEIISCCHVHTAKSGCNNFASVWGITIMLKNTTTLKQLNLWSCGITVQEAAAISEKTKTNTLEKLNVGANNLSDDGVKLISEVLSSKTCNLQSLHINDNKIGPLGIGAIAQALLLNKSLLVLNMTNNEVGQEGAVALADAIMINETLEELLLCGEKTLTEDSAILLLDKLYNSNTTIIKLGLTKKFANNNCIHCHTENINERRKWYNKQDVKFRFY